MNIRPVWKGLPALIAGIGLACAVIVLTVWRIVN